MRAGRGTLFFTPRRRRLESGVRLPGRARSGRSLCLRADARRTSASATLRSCRRKVVLVSSGCSRRCGYGVVGLGEASVVAWLAV